MRLGTRKQVMALLGVTSPTTIDNLERRGLLPERIRITDNRVRWDMDEVERMLRERPRGIDPLPETTVEKMRDARRERETSEARA